MRSTLFSATKTELNVVWQSVAFNHCRVTVQRLFSKFSQIAWNVHRYVNDSHRRSRDLNHCRVTDSTVKTPLGAPEKEV